MMEALLEIVDQLLYLLEQCSDDEDAHSAQMIALLEGLAREALELAKHVRQNAQYNVEDRHAVRRESLLQKALEAIAYMRLEDAESILERALEEFPEHDEYYNHLGLVAWERGDMPRAERYYARAAQLALTNMGLETNWLTQTGNKALRAMEGQALCLYRMGQLDEARELFETLAMTCVPDYQGCYYLAGEICHSQGQPEKALELYALAPFEPSVLYNMALVHYTLHDIESCTTTLLRAFSANPFICQALLGRNLRSRSMSVGYLASAPYAEEFMDACGPLWQDRPEARSFMQRCFDHPLTQQRLRQDDFDEFGPAMSLGMGGEIQTTDILSTDEWDRYQGLAQRLLEQLLF